MSLKSEIHEEKNRVTVNLTLPHISNEINFPFIDSPPSELRLDSDKLIVELEKTHDINKQLEMGVIVDGRHYSLSKLSYAGPPTEKYQVPIEPPERSSIEEVEERLRNHGILPTVTSTIKELPHEEQTPKIEPREHKIQNCPECGSTNSRTDYDQGEVVCTDCGYVLVDKLTDRGPEYRVFDDEQRAKRTRTGAPTTYTIHDKGLSTMIDWHDRDIFGKSLSPGQKAQIYRLRKWQKRTRIADATERNKAFALTEMTRIANNMTLPRNALETASIIYQKAVKGKAVEVLDKKTKQKRIVNMSLIRGRSVQGMTAASIYLACRQCGLSRTLEEVSQASNVNKKSVSRDYRFLIRELDYTAPPQKPSQYVTKFSNQLTMQGKVEDIAYKILNAAKEAKLTAGRGPTGVAAAASYIASVLTGERKTQREIAEIAQVTEVTIRNRYKELVEKLQFNYTL